MTTDKLTIEQAKNIVDGVIGQAEEGKLSAYPENNRYIASQLRQMWTMRTSGQTAHNGACDTAKLAMDLVKQFAR